MLTIDCKNGSLNIFYDECSVTNVYMSIQYDGGHYNRLEIKSGKWTLEKENGAYFAHSGNFSLRFRETGGGFLWEASYVAEKMVKKALSFKAFGGFWSCKIKSAVINGFTECNGNRVNEMLAQPETVFFADNQKKISSDAAVFTDEKKRTAVFGPVTFGRFFCETSVDSCGELFSEQILDGHDIKEGEILVGDRGCFIFGKDKTEALENYARAVRKEAGVCEKLKDVPSGWCSWYYYGPDISEEIILENVRALKERKVNVKYVQIDDGWARKRGDWEPNEKFPDMKLLADKIRAAGFVPGIWIAPFSADENSEFYREHRDWLVKNYEDDKIFGYPSIDYSRPEAREYLWKLFSKISREWGFRYIKIDLVLGSISAGRHFDSGYNAVKNYRTALEIIRKAVTDDTYLLACTSPIGASIGIVDGVRISEDIFENWEALKRIARPVLKRFYYNGSLFNNDADCFLSRTAKNEDGQCFRLCTRTEEEIRMHVSLIAASGGAVFLSDKISLLSDKQIREIGYLLPPSNLHPQPLDLETSDIPAVVDCGKTEHTRTVIFFNWNNRVRVRRLNMDKNVHIFEFWSQKYYGKRKSVCFTLPPHTAKIFFLTDDLDIVPVGCDNSVVPIFRLNRKDNLFMGMLRKNQEKWVVFSEKRLYAEKNCTLESIGEKLYAVKSAEGVSMFTVRAEV